MCNKPKRAFGRHCFDLIEINERLMNETHSFDKARIYVCS